jgi:hypothetical protein
MVRGGPNAGRRVRIARMPKVNKHEVVRIPGKDKSLPEILAWLLVHVEMYFALDTEQFLDFREAAEEVIIGNLHSAAKKSGVTYERFTEMTREQAKEMQEAANLYRAPVSGEKH